MTTTPISYTTIESSSYNNVYSAMNDRNNIADPRDPDGKNIRMFLYDFDPFHLSINFADMPYVILELPQIEYIRMSLHGKRKGILFKHRIVVRTARRGAGNTRNTDVGRTDMLTITDDLHQMFNGMTQRDRFRILNMVKVKLTKISTDTLSVDGKYMYESVFELEYESPLLTVSL